MGNIANKAEILQKHYDLFRASLGMQPSHLSEKAQEHLINAMQEYSDCVLLSFVDHLQTKYPTIAEVRFDFMLLDFKEYAK